MGTDIKLQRNDAYPGVAVGYALPAPHLRAYISTISHILVEDRAGLVVDQLYPEWGNLRYSVGGRMTVCTGPGPLEDCSPSGGIGPTSHATHFSLTPGRYWGMGFTPLGWSRFVEADASDHAERWAPIVPDSIFHRFTALLDIVQDTDTGAVIDGINRHVDTLLESGGEDDARITRAHAALVDPSVTTVAEFADRVGMTVRSLERLSSAAFGFPPKLLMRRQRFLRSLQLYMLDPSLAWLQTLDTQYVDQAHFIRDFKRFMDTTPRKYAALPHPVIWAAAQARARTTGTAMQVLQEPSSGKD